MNYVEFKKNLIQYLKNMEYSKILELPYEYRLQFFADKDLFVQSGRRVFVYNYLDLLSKVLFSEEEAIKAFNQSDNIDIKVLLLLAMPSQMIAENIDLICQVDESIYSDEFLSFDDFINAFCNKLDNQNDIDKLLIKFINNSPMFNLRNFSKSCDVLSKLSSDALLNILDEIIEKSNNSKIGYIFDYSFLLDLINVVSENKRINVLLKLFKIKVNDNIILNDIRVDDLVKIVKDFNFKDKKEIIELYINSNEKIKDSSNIIRILSLFNADELKVFLEDNKDIMNNQNMKYHIVDFFKEGKYFSKEFDDYFSMFLILDRKYSLKWFTSYSYSNILSFLPNDEELERVFFKYFDAPVNAIVGISSLFLDVKFKLVNLMFKHKDEYDSDELDRLLFEITEGDNADFIDNKKNTYPYLDEYIVNKYNLNYNNYKEYIDRFNYRGLKILSSPNLQKALRMNEGDFLKYLDLFNESHIRFNNDDVNSICNALFQREFRFINQDDYMIFSRVETLLDNPTVENKATIDGIIQMIGEYVDLNIYINRYDGDFISDLYNGRKDALNLFHNITNEYISKKRDIYCRKRLDNITNELNLDKKVNRLFYKKNIINFIDSSSDFIWKFKEDNIEVTSEQKELLDNKELINRLIAFKKDPQNFKLENEEKSKLKIFEQILDLLYQYNYKLYVFDSEKYEGQVEYDYFPFEISADKLLDIFVNIDPDILTKNVLNNKNVYDFLCEMLSKYHLLGIGETFRPICHLSDIDIEDSTLACIMSYFNEIYPRLDKKSSYITKMIDLGNEYDVLSKRYKLLLGKEDYSLIAANEGKNKAPISKNKRLERTVELIKIMNMRESVTVPPINDTYTLNNGKKIDVVLGNSSDPINLTYGERTNACLRIGGAFNDLFEYCLKNPNGFHIRLSDPNIGKFISRVSGIRNGNTVFLNELRESVDENYSNEELYECIKLISSTIVEESKKSDFPIDNIVITSDYALKDHEEEEVSLGLPDRNEALKRLHFNIKNEGVGLILKTSNDDNSLVPYNFSDDVPSYPVIRSKPKIYHGKEAIDKIIQLNMIDGLLGGIPFDQIIIDENINVDYVIIGQGWYITYNNTSGMQVNILPNCTNREAAEAEINCLLDSMNKEEDRGKRI